MARLKELSLELRTMLLALFLAACALYHILAHDHWLATARDVVTAVAEGLKAITTVSPVVWATLWVVIALAGLAGVAFVVFAYTRSLPVWLERVRLGMALLFSVWLWTGGNAQSMFDQWLGVRVPGDWTALAFLLGDWLLLCSAALAFVSCGWHITRRLFAEKDDGGAFVIYTWFSAFSLVGLLVAPYLCRVELPETREKRVEQELWQQLSAQLATGWTVETLGFPLGFIWTSPSREMSAVFPSKKQALQDALQASKNRPELNKLDNRLPDGWKIKTELGAGDRQHYRIVDPVSGEASTTAYWTRQAALGQAWREYYALRLRKMVPQYRYLEPVAGWRVEQ